MAGVSAWNSAGTWEERDFSDWSHKRIKEKLNGINWKSGEDHINVTADAVTGDGRKRLGFDLEIKFKFKGQAQGNIFTGTGVLTLESDTGGDVEFSLTHEATCGRFLEVELKRLINAEIKVWKDELIQK